MLSQQELNSLLAYNPATGNLMWRVNTGKKRLVGTDAGATRRDGYVRIRINNKDYYAHRIAWAITYGEWPTAGLDHINGNPSDNRIANLRPANQSQNLANSRKRKWGVSPKRGRYRAQIMVNYRFIHLGTFDTPEEARTAYEQAAIRYFGEYARPR